MWSEDLQNTNGGKVYNPKYLVGSVGGTACHELLPPCVWAVWIYV